MISLGRSVRIASPTSVYDGKVGVVRTALGFSFYIVDLENGESVFAQEEDLEPL